MTNITADFAKNKERAAGRYRQNLIDTHGCYLLNEPNEEGLFTWGDELGGESVPVSCVSFEVGGILDRENQRGTEEDRGSGSVRTRGEAKNRGEWRDLSIQD